MDFSYNNFSFKATQIGQKKLEKGKGEEVKEEEKPSAKSTPETVVLTGSAQDIAAVIAKATVKGAMGGKGTAGVTGVTGDPDALQQLLDEYNELLAHWHVIENGNDWEDKINCLQSMQSCIHDIIEGHGNELEPNVAEQLATDYVTWGHELAQMYDPEGSMANGGNINGGNVNGGGPVNGGGDPNAPADLIDGLSYEWEQHHQHINADFMFNHLRFMQRVTYFKGLVNEYTNFLNNMESTAQIYFGENFNPSHPNYTQYIELHQVVQAKLTEAQNYLTEALRVIPSSASEKLNAEQSQGAR